MKLMQYQNHLPRAKLATEPGVPLWKVAPTHDETGASLCDFMMLIPRLKNRHALYIRDAQSYIGKVLACYPEVVFANMDMRLNVLWISHRHRPGIMLEIVTAIRKNIPEAVLVAQNTQA